MCTLFIRSFVILVVAAYFLSRLRSYAPVLSGARVVWCTLIWPWRRSSLPRTECSLVFFSFLWFCVMWWFWVGEGEMEWVTAKSFVFCVVCGWWVVSLVYLLVGFYLWVWAIFYIALLVSASGFMGLWFILKKNVFSLEIYLWWLYWLKICCKFFWIVIVSLMVLASGFCWIYLISFWFWLMGFWYPTKENAGKVGRVIFLILWRLIYGG